MLIVHIEISCHLLSYYLVRDIIFIINLINDEIQFKCVRQIIPRVISMVTTESGMSTRLICLYIDISNPRSYHLIFPTSNCLTLISYVCQYLMLLSYEMSCLEGCIRYASQYFHSIVWRRLCQLIVS